MVKDNKDLKHTLQKVVSTENGKKLLAYLKRDYLLRSSIQDTVEKTYYELGRKELVQDLILLLESPEELDNIILQ